jgi:hypothetical protein
MPAGGVTTSLVSCVMSVSVPSCGVGANANVAGCPFTVTEETSSWSWKSKLNSERSCVAVALIVVRAAPKRFVTGS